MDTYVRFSSCGNDWVGNPQPGNSLATHKVQILSNTSKLLRHTYIFRTFIIF
jgi:hypothetical protein